MAHTTRPSMPLTLSGTKIVYRDWTYIGVRTRPILSVGWGGPRQVYDVRTDQASRIPALGRAPPGCSIDNTVTRPRAQPVPVERGRYSGGSAATRVNIYRHAVPASACRVGGRAARKSCCKAVIPGSRARSRLLTGGWGGEACAEEGYWGSALDPASLFLVGIKNLLPVSAKPESGMAADGSHTCMSV